ncbi:glycosyltransferase family 2 protein [Gordonia mangrovi]|uniref:glycosyltransferase family 2 protein n=1 Tax=Gordonia mangrovi TaxID=2665643 RepID=UPI0013690140|nr:glycosyltransferase family 2 protein [Gordonia mangrovi]UVF79102.1 glycosyltransferase [Gordonia mangrovi]
MTDEAQTEVEVQRLSVCVPLFNSADTVTKCLESVLSQTYENFECLVVDNASTDGTAERVREFDDPRIRLVRNEHNVGLVGNHNRCIELARGSVVQFVHGDDWLLPHCLERLLPYFDDPQVGLAFAPRTVESDDTEWKAHFSRLETPLSPLAAVNDGQELIRRHLAAGGGGNPIGEPTAVMVRRETLIEAGGFRADVPQLQDIDAWLRVMTLGDVAYVDEPLTVRWHHAGSETDIHQGAPSIDRMWVMTGLMQRPELDNSLRRRAVNLWLRSLWHVPEDLMRNRKDQRLALIKRLGRQLTATARRRPLTFSATSS